MAEKKVEMANVLKTELYWEEFNLSTVLKNNGIKNKGSFKSKSS